VLRAPIDFDALPKETPRTICELVKRCLDRDVKNRLQAIGEARIAIQKYLANPATVPDVTQSTPSRSWLGWVAWGVAGMLALALGVVSYRHVSEEQLRVVKVSVLPPEKATFKYTSLPAVSPDGRRLAFVVTLDGKDSLWVRDLDSLTARALTGTEGANDPFWSPDSRFVAFFAGGKLKKIDVAGGPVLTLYGDASLGRGGSWSKNDVIVFNAFNTNGISRVPAAGGSAVPLTTLDQPSGETGHRFPWFLPDGRHFLYSTFHTEREKNAIYIADLDSKSRRLVVTADSNAVYTPPGYLLFVRERTLMAQPFDAGKLQTTGDAFPIAEQIDSAGVVVQKQFSASQNGVLAYTSGGARGGLQLTWIDRSGKVTGNVGPPGIYNNFRLAPDEKRITFDQPDAQTGSADVWVMDLVRGVTSRLTFDPSVDNLPIWSPDGLRILYPNNRSGTFDLYVKAATGAGQEEVLVKLGTPTGWGTHWSRDGRFIMYEIPGDKTGRDLWIAPQFGDRKPFPYLHAQFNESEGNFSPDGRWVAYVSDESGRNEIYVQAFPLSGAKFQISTGGGTQPTWRKDGTELFYLAADRNLMAVPIKSGATLEVGVSKSLFPIAVTAQRHSYAVTNDGLRFLVSTSAGGEKMVPMTVVLNWTAQLKK
jgi:eukaryotic-like serine/threonine-protein kinase